MSAKMATLGFLKLKVYKYKVYDVTIFVHNVTNKILSCNANYIVDVIM